MEFTQTSRCKGRYPCSKYNDDRCCCECSEDEGCSGFCGYVAADYCEDREKLSNPIDTNT